MTVIPVFTDYETVAGATVLPTFLGWVVDMKRRVFCRLEVNKQGWPTGIKEIPFSSIQGDAMLACVVQIAGKNRKGRLWQELVTIWKSRHM